VADTNLKKEHGLALLTKLAQDDAFRAHYEQKPAEALLQLGVPADLICGLPARCLCPRKAAPKADMEHARKQLAGDLDTSTLALMIPTPKL
jgi:putative modified peptide